jgi:hypothetical protein
MKKKIIKLHLSKHTVSNLQQGLKGGADAIFRTAIPCSAIDACPSAMVPGGCTGNATCADQTTCYYQQTCNNTCANTCMATCLGAGGCGNSIQGFYTCYPNGGCSGPICVQPL